MDLRKLVHTCLKFTHVIAHNYFLQSTKGFRLVTDNGCQIILSPKYLDEIRQHNDLSRDMASAKELMAHLPGFEVFREVSKGGKILHDAVLTKLTRALGR